jgi:hypothetical protein
MERRAADQAHRDDIHNQAIEAICAISGFSREDAEQIVFAIAEGLIPHLKIEY